ncbi:MAG TPA: hypothetical protein VKA31_05725 [Mariprofundaceae bacterium]|nr:hypothetical protein [Mariprofundaceae bacterium]
MDRHGTEPKKDENNMTPAGRIAFGSIFILFGIFPMLAAFDIGPLGVKDINGPPWLGIAAGGIFVAGGLAVMLQKTPLAQVLSLLILVGLAAIGNWIGFGVGERICTSNFDLFGYTGEHSGLACRIPFGFGAIVMDAILIYVLMTTLQKLLGGPPQLARLLKLAEWGIWISLLPILLPVLLFLIGKSALDASITRIRTGEWPRNEAFIARQKRKGLLRKMPGNSKPD